MEEFNDGNWGIRINEKHYCKFDIEALTGQRLNLVFLGTPRVLSGMNLKKM